MNYLDLYLQRNNSKRYDIHKKTGISQQLLSTHTNKNIDKYSNKVIIALAQSLNKTPGNVLDELLLLQAENPSYEAFNPSELLIGLKAKYDTIVVKGPYYTEILKYMQSHLSDTETLGFEVGSNGMITIFAYAINRAMELFSNSHSIDDDIERTLMIYKIADLSEDKLTLRLKQLDY